MRTSTLIASLTAVLVVGLAGQASAKHVRFIGQHPVANKFGGGYCYIEVPHLHGYGPDRAALYQQVADQYVFTGDPTPFGYEGERHPFYGHHPVVSVNGEPVYCFLDGPHYHPFTAPESPEYRVKNGVAFYVGPFAPAYAKARPHRVKMVNAEYRPYVSMRPTIQVEPPPEWHGEVYVATPSVQVSAPGVYVDVPHPRATIEVSAPGVYVAPPSPVFVAPPSPHVVVGAPGVYVGAPGVSVRSPGVYVGAPGVSVRAPGVYVAPPAPHVVVGAPGVVVGAPGVVVGAPGVRVRGHHGHGDDDDGHHDNGKHKGWYK